MSNHAQETIKKYPHFNKNILSFEQKSFLVAEGKT